MKAVEVKRRIAEVETRLGQLEQWLGTLKAARDKYLVLPEDDIRARDALQKIENGWQRGEVIPPELVGAPTQSGLPAVEQEIVQLKHKRRLLEAELPSKEAVATAQQRALELEKQAKATETLFRDGWSSFMEAMAEAEEAARQVVEARAKAQETFHELSGLCEQYALGIHVAREPRPDPSEENLAGVLGSLLRDVGYFQVVDRGLDAEVESARRPVEREAA